MPLGCVSFFERRIETFDAREVIQLLLAKIEY